MDQRDAIARICLPTLVIGSTYDVAATPLAEVCFLTSVAVAFAPATL